MKKKSYVFLGSLSLGLGVLGIFLPLLPTVPFVLLAASCYLKGSPKRYKWLMEHRYFGKIIKDFTLHKRIALKTKIVSLSVLWISIGRTCYSFVSSTWLRCLLLAIAIGVTIHILSYSSKKKMKKEDTQ